MVTNRRLIETIRGRAKAGDTQVDLPLAVRPRVVRAAQRATLVVGTAALGAALLAGAASPLVRTAADAGLAGAGQRPAPRSAARGGPVDAELESQSAMAPVTAALPGGVPVVPAQLVALPRLQLAAAPAAPVAPRPVVATTSPPTTPPTTVAPAPPPAPGSVEATITEVFGAHGPAAIRVARCESGLNPRAVSRGGKNWGLFQINTVHRSRVVAMGYQWEDLLDARVNALVARSIFDEQGWRPWGCRRAAG